MGVSIVDRTSQLQIFKNLSTFYQDSTHFWAENEDKEKHANRRPDHVRMDLRSSHDLFSHKVSCYIKDKNYIMLDNKIYIHQYCKKTTKFCIKVDPRIFTIVVKRYHHRVDNL